ERREQRQLPSPPAPLPLPLAAGQISKCTATILRGQRKGQPCGCNVGGRVPGKCKHHDGLQQRRKRKSTADTTLLSDDEDEEPNYDSDQEVGGGMDE
ncbi:unnamed protein product, partial [Scytosiphon promiscuus]